MTRTKEQTEAIITALTKLSEKFYADMDKIVNGVEIYEPDIKIEGGKATFKPIEGIELDPVKYWDQVRIEEVPEPNEVTEEECQELINEIDQFSRDYDPHGYALPIYKDNDNPNQDMIEIVKKWAIERMNKPPQDTTSQESKDYWKKHYNN